MKNPVMGRRAAVSGALALGLVGCASPNPKLYTIAVVPGPTFQKSPDVVLLRELAIARYLERTQIVASSESYRLDVRSNEWWGEPLSAMLSRILVLELGQRLPSSSVYAENGAVTTEPDATVELNIQRLDEDARGQLVLIAQAAVSKPASKGRTLKLRRGFRFVVSPTGHDIPAQVAAISRAVGDLADGLAGMLSGS